MANFEIAYKATMNTEGGYANDPDDKGGETYAGISRKNFPSWLGWGIIDQLKSVPNFPGNLEQNQTLNLEVKGFYKKCFWDILRLDQFASQPIATELFDLGVNCYTTTAAKFLQRSLNVLNNNGQLFPDLDVDGNIGGSTLAALPLCNPRDVLSCIVSLQGAYYIGICEKNHTQEKFMKGWVRRAFSRYSLGS